MKREAIRRLVAAARVGRLATVGAGGRPHVVPFCYVLSGEAIYSAVDEKPKRSRTLQRLENIRRNPVATVLIDHYEEDWTRLWWVRLEGTGRIVTTGEEQARAQSLLLEKYEQYQRQPPPGPLLAVDIQRWLAWAADSVP